MPVIQDFSNYQELQKKPENASRAAFLIDSVYKHVDLFEQWFEFLIKEKSL